MSDALSTRTYAIDFFQISHISTTEVPTLNDGFNSIIDGEVESISDTGGYTRDIWNLTARKRPGSFVGQLRKFRTTDLPETGRAGGTSKQLLLADDEGVVERNFFVYYKQHQLLGWHRNGHGNSPRQLAAFLSSLWGTRVSIDPVLQPEAIKRLMNGNIDLKKITLTVPRPTNPDLYPDDDYGKEIIELMNKSGADSVHIVLGIDTRRGDTDGKLSGKLKRAMSELTAMGATTARAVVYDDGLEHPIDLIADRVVSYQDIETNARFPPSATMYEAIDKAREECKGAINDYFGEMENAIT
ncbi:DUF6731 family protein [Pseudomonas moorei]|uniref:DUF6731 family protein n=1 Tax=Pseudomonas moorei TaxID=395599 RepID=UPI00200C25C4|nr:DUF6731 family protein [Pseudomonas moorei]